MKDKRIKFCWIQLSRTGRTSNPELRKKIEKEMMKDELDRKVQTEKSE